MISCNQYINPYSGPLILCNSAIPHNTSVITSIPKTDPLEFCFCFSVTSLRPFHIFWLCFFKIASFEKPRKFMCEKFKRTLNNHRRQALTYAFETQSCAKMLLLQEVYSRIDRTKNFYSSFALLLCQSILWRIQNCDWKVISKSLND